LQFVSKENFISPVCVLILMLIPAILLVVFLIVLAKSADIVVESTSRISKYLGISTFAIGVVLVAIVTSLPELSVAIVSSVAGEGALSAGTVFGSNIANILLVMGIGAFVYGLSIPWKHVGEIGLILLLTTIISAYIILSSNVQGNALGLPAGIILLVMFAGYIYYILRKNNKKEIGTDKKTKVDRKKTATAFLVFIAGIIVVFISSALVVDNAVIVAQELGIAHSIIGATIIAIGTSLPELSTTLQAIRRKTYGVVVGNIVGSNMTNLTLILGTTAVINEINVNLSIFIAALLFAIVANAILLFFAAVTKNMGRYSGLLFLVIYVFFIITILTLQARELTA